MMFFRPKFVNGLTPCQNMQPKGKTVYCLSEVLILGGLFIR